MVERFHATGQLPTTLQLIGQGRVPGLQGIHRAELLAITIVCEATDAVEVYTDSQVALDAIDLVRRSTSVWEYQKHPEFGLLLRLAAVLKPTHVFHKIAAHTDVSLSMHAEEAYLYLGNRAADEAANRAVRDILPSFAEDLQEHATTISGTQDMYKAVLEYIVDLQTARAKADQGDDFSGSIHQQQALTHDPYRYLADWSPEPAWTMSEEVDRRWFHRTAWGSDFADAAIQWLQGCRWPDQTTVRSTSAVGISWLEIALGIMHYLGEYIPIRRYDHEGRLHLLRLRNQADLHLHNATLREMGENTAMLFSHLVALTTTELFPCGTRGRVKSLYLLGEGHFSQGFLLRPQSQYQEEVVIQVQLYLQSNRAMPDLGFNLPSEAYPETCWKTRLRDTQLAMKEVRVANAVSPHHS